MSLEFRLSFVLTVVHQFPEVVSQYFNHVARTGFEARMHLVELR